MARQRYKLEEIVSQLRQAEVLHGWAYLWRTRSGSSGISEVTPYHWRKEYGGMAAISCIA